MSMHKRACHVGRVCFILSLAFLAVSGCTAGYKAPNLPSSEVATVAADGPLWITAVDALSTCSISQTTGRKTVVLAPGKHTLKARYNKDGLMAEGSLDVSVTAGKRYLLTCAVQGYHVIFLLEEEKVPEAPGKTGVRHYWRFR